MFFIIFPVLTLLGAGLHLLLSKRTRTKKRVVEILLLYFLAISVGLQGIFAFYGHAFMGDAIAKSIGWEPSPFQFEVAVANLAFGVLGILCIWIRSNFWLTTGIGVSVWLLGDAYGHIGEVVINQNYAPNNAGPALYSDILLPLVILGLLMTYRFLSRTPRTYTLPSLGVRTSIACPV